MDEYVLAAILAGDETKPLGVVKPFDLSDDRNGGRRIGRDPTRWSNPIARWPLWPLDNAGGVDFEHPRHLRALGAGADLDAQLGAGRDSVMSSGMQGVGMQERVARAARQLDEPVAFVRLEPFDHRIDLRRARIDRRGAAAHGWAAKTPCVRTAP